MGEQVAVDERTVLRVRRAVERAGPPAATVNEAAWRRSRDDLLDDFEAGREAQVPPSRIRDLIDFLAEALPSQEARMNSREWERAVTAITDELLSLLSH
ncbi:MAG: hypothetical protein M3116_02270 [Actinomycetota bacterium]|nr:hypothetical protein [Actinomycetota bacterium]